MLFNATTNIFAGKILLAKQWSHASAAEQYKLASNARAAALLLYPDPQQYGGPKGSKPFPDSRWLPPDGVRSDSILWNGGGDPQTYGLPSNSHAFKDMLEFYQTVYVVCVCSVDKPEQSAHIESIFRPFLIMPFPLFTFLLHQHPLAANQRPDGGPHSAGAGRPGGARRLAGRLQLHLPRRSQAEGRPAVGEGGGGQPPG